jgi:hypothetical protein
MGAPGTAACRTGTPRLFIPKEKLSAPRVIAEAFKNFLRLIFGTSCFAIEFLHMKPAPRGGVCVAGATGVCSFSEFGFVCSEYKKMERQK